MSCAPAMAERMARARDSLSSELTTAAADRTLLSHATFTSAKVWTSFFTASGRSSYSAAMKLQRHMRLSLSSACAPLNSMCTPASVSATAACELLGVPKKTLYDKVRRLGTSPDQFK